MVKIDNFYIEKNTLNCFCLKILLKKKKKRIFQKQLPNKFPEFCF